MYTLANFNNPMVWVAIAVVVVVLFGGQKIPELMRNLGRSKSEFEKGMREGHLENNESRRESKV